MSDHGGDESPFAQERYNHNTPRSKFHNEAFLSFYNHWINKSDYSDGIIYSNFVSEIITSFLKDTNSIGEFKMNFDFYWNTERLIEWMKFFNLRLNLFRDHFKIDMNFDKFLKIE